MQSVSPEEVHEVVIERAMRALYYNAMERTLYLKEVGSPPFVGEPLSDGDSEYLRGLVNSELTAKGRIVKPLSKRAWGHYLSAISFLTKRLPFREFLDTVSDPEIKTGADAEGYLKEVGYDRWEIKGGRTPYTDFCLMLVYLTVAARTYYPGIWTNIQLALFGAKGVGVEDIPSNILPSEFNSSLYLPSLNLSKHPCQSSFVSKIAGKAICRLDNLGFMVARAERSFPNRVKSTLSSGYVNARRPYERSSSVTRYTHAFIGTDNLDSGNLPLPEDPVTACRFAPIEIERIKKVPSDHERIRDFVAAKVYLEDKVFTHDDPEKNRMAGDSFIRLVPPHLRDEHWETVRRYKRPHRADRLHA